MPRGERRTKKEILIAQIESKDAKIDFFEIKIDKLTQEKAELQGQLDYLIESEANISMENSLQCACGHRSNCLHINI